MYKISLPVFILIHAFVSSLASAKATVDSIQFIDKPLWRQMVWRWPMTLTTSLLLRSTISQPCA